MKYLGIDYGSKRVGVAISDKTKTLVKPLTIIKYHNDQELFIEIKNILLSYEIEKIILGFPKNMNNTEGKSAKKVLQFKEDLESFTCIPIELIDERLTTSEAENILLEADFNRRKRKEIIDGMAAAIILETYIKKEKNENERKEKQFYN